MPCTFSNILFRKIEKSKMRFIITSGLNFFQSITQNRHLKKYWRIYTFFGLFFITLALRLPLANSLPFHQDSFLYLRGIEKFDIINQSPHPPGYILYIALGKLINILTVDPHQSLIVLSVLASALTTPVIFFLTRALFKRIDIAIVAAAFTLTAPIIWFYGEIALNYSLETLMGSLLAYLLFTARQRKSWSLIILATIFLGLIGGVRQNNLLFLFPLWLLVAYQFRIKKVLALLTLLVITCLSWLGPMIYLTGGLENYWLALSHQGTDAVWDSSFFIMGLNGLWANLLFLTKHVATGLYSLLYFTILLLLVGIMTKFKYTSIINKRGQNRWTLIFLLVWIIPAFIFYLSIIARIGYIMTIVPVLIIFMSFFIIITADKVHVPSLKNNQKKLALAIIIAILCLTNIGFFIFSTTPEISFQYLKILNYDIESLRNTVPQKFPAQESIILTDHGQIWSRDKAAYYFPQYHVYTARASSPLVAPPGKPVEGFYQNQKFYDTHIKVGPNIKQLVFFNSCQPEDINPFPETSLSLIRDKDCLIATISLENEQNREALGQNDRFLLE